jgi:hypothetical protein
LDAKIKRKWAAVVGGVIYILLSSNEITRENETHLTMYLIVLIILIITIEAKLKHKTLAILMSILVISCADEVFGIPIKYIYSQYKGFISVDHLYVLTSSLASFGFVGVITMIKRKKNINEIDKYKEYVKNSMPILILILAIVLAFTIGGLNYEKNYIQDEDIILFLNCTSIVSFISIIFLTWFMMYIHSTNKKMEEMLGIERNLNEMQLQYYRVMLEKEENTRYYRHDMNNHLICLNQLAKEGKVDLVSDYVNVMQKQMSDIKQKVYIVGNEILDAILNYHLSMLDQNVRIHVIGGCQEELSISNVDLCTIFANLIQNAVEELNKDSMNEKQLKVVIKAGMEYLKLEISNSISDSSLEKSNLLITNKKDKLNHGLGLLNIKKAVDKNGGKFETKIMKQEFIVSVILKK